MTLKKRPVGEGGLLRPLAKGKACAQCKARKVRCDAVFPACGSCSRTAQFSNQDPNSIKCTYIDPATVKKAAPKNRDSVKRQRSNSADRHLSREQDARDSEVNNNVAPITYRRLQQQPLVRPSPPPLVRSSFSSSTVASSSSSSSAYSQRDSASTSTTTYSCPGSPPTPSNSEDLFAHAFKNNTFPAAMPPNPDFCRISPSGWASLTPQPYDANHYPIQSSQQYLHNQQLQYQYQSKPQPSTQIQTQNLERRNSYVQIQPQQQQSQVEETTALHIPIQAQHQPSHYYQQQQQPQQQPQQSPPQQQRQQQQYHQSQAVPQFPQQQQQRRQSMPSPSLFASTIQKTYAFPSHLFHMKTATLPQENSPYPQPNFPTLVSPRAVLNNSVNGYFDVPAQISPIYPFKLTPGFSENSASSQFSQGMSSHGGINNMTDSNSSYFGVDWTTLHGNGNGTISNVDAGRWTPGVGWRGEERWVM